MTLDLLKARRWTERVAAVRSRTPRVLVVDDNINAADAIAAYLELAELKTLAVYGGVAAIAATCIWKPDVVLLDISMPGMDGFAVAKTLRQSAATLATLIIAFTAFDEAFVRKPSEASDFDAYCQKGVRLETLDAILSSVIIRNGDKVGRMCGKIPR